VARLILDTGVLIAAARSRLDLAGLADEDDIAIPALAIAEFLTGVELETDPKRRAHQRAFVDDVLTVVPVADYTRQTAVHHAALLAHTRRSGRPRGPHDLVIAATARATGRILLTTDVKADFGDLPGVAVRVVEQ
jgi:tRNA(fMet)-specific endonuclease VapC